MNDEITKNFLKNLMDIWIAPEIERRKRVGKIDDTFKLRGFQIIFHPDDGTFNKIRLNDEVKAIAKCKMLKAKKSKEFVYENDIESIESVELPNRKNFGHVTGLFIKGAWNVFFDFRYNQKIVQKHLSAAKEFLGSAEDNLTKKRLMPFYDNCFSCAELLARGLLLQLPNKELKISKSHDFVNKELTNWAKLGNTKPEYAQLLSKLYGLRSSARYLNSTEFLKEKPQDTLKILEEMFESVAQTCGYIK